MSPYQPPTFKDDTYKCELTEDRLGGFMIAGIRYGAKWISRPKRDLDFDFMAQVVRACAERGRIYERDEGYLPERVEAEGRSSTKSITTKVE